MSKNVSKKIYCGECSFFEHEDIYGIGYCDISRREQHCGDLCKLITDGMHEQETLRMLHYCQKWRRGAKTKMPRPTLFGLAIDSAMRIIRAKVKEESCNQAKR